MLIMNSKRVMFELSYLNLGSALLTQNWIIGNREP